MEVKKLEILIFLKTFFIFFFLLLFFFSLINYFYFFRVSRYFTLSFEEKILPFFFRLSFDKVSFIFLIMVCLVTRLVLVYSEFYIEFYNNKKFYFLTISFFSFIGILSLSGRIINLIIG